MPGEPKEITLSYNALKKQRDDLLAACRRAYPYLPQSNHATRLVAEFVKETMDRAGAEDA